MHGKEKKWKKRIGIRIGIRKRNRNKGKHYRKNATCRKITQGIEETCPWEVQAINKLNESEFNKTELRYIIFKMIGW